MIFTIEEIKTRLALIFEKYNVKLAVLFGSYAKGLATSESDVDIIVDSGLAGLKFMALYCDIQNALDGRELDLLDYYEVKPNSNLKMEIERTGVCLYRVT